LGVRIVIRVFVAAAVVVLAASAWFFLAPPGLGGRTSYAIVSGSSMWPELAGGDLAVVRKRSDYAPGDAVLYRDPEIGVEILHRIVRVEHGRFVLKGDNNDFLDDPRLTGAEIDGSLWFSLPYAGTGLRWLQVPLHAALVIFFLTILSFGGPRRQRRARASSP
jgi:signal peptidase I